MFEFLVNWVANIPGSATPYALAALGLILCERAGVLALGAEGFMLVGALSGIASFLEFGGHPLLALIVAMLATAVVSLLFSVLVIYLRVNQVISGLMLVFFCEGLTGLIGTLCGWTNQPIAGLSSWPIWPLSEIPVLGPIIFRQNLVVYLTVPIFFLAAHVLRKSMIGLRLRSVGESPDAADAAGVNVSLYRLGAVTVGSAIVGLAGAYLSVVDAKLWIGGITNGRGWIAIALVIFARWQPWRALFGALLFGCIEALIPRVAAAGIQVPQYFVLMSPYIATLAVMVWAGTTNRLGASGPAALGMPHIREERR